MSKAKLDIFKKNFSEKWDENATDEEKQNLMRELLMVGLEKERVEMVETLNDTIEELTNVLGLLLENKAPVGEDFAKAREPFRRFTELYFETIGSRTTTLELAKIINKK